MVAHVLVFPFPVQGDINCMLSFAAGLLHAGLHVSFLHSDHNRRRLGLATAESNPSTSPRLRFLSVPDGLPDDHPRSAGGLAELIESLRTNTSVAYRALLPSLCAPTSVGGFPPVTCVVADGMLPFAIDVAEDLGVPALAFRTASACSFLAYLSVPNLVELGEVPVPAGAADLDAPVRGVPGMEGFLRRRDLPSFCRGHDENGGLDPLLQIFHEVTAHSCKARALIFNTAASLERSALAHVAPRMAMGDVFAIGPLHAMFQAPAAGGGALWREDDGCTAWLDGQADRSVVYVSLGSLAVISLEQFTEFLSGLVGAGHPFLWVLRPDMAGGPRQSAVLQEAIRAAGRSKARVVDWAPQRDVLRHRAVGCFLTHAGWNSTLECVAEGVPTVCWPFFADQQTNSRLVRRAMESGELRGSAQAQALAQEVRRDIAEGGSSATEFKRLVSFINELSNPEHHQCISDPLQRIPTQ